MTAVSTRIATLTDVDAIAPLFDAYRQFYQRAPDLPLATGFIRDRLQANESVILLAEDPQGRALGFCQLYPSFCSVSAAAVYILYDLFVRPDARKSGVGRALMRTAEEHAGRHGFSRLELSTARTNRTAQSLYESLGWVRDEHFFVYSKRVVG